MPSEASAPGAAWRWVRSMWPMPALHGAIASAPVGRAVSFPSLAASPSPAWPPSSSAAHSPGTVSVP
eukprot:11226914-Lingulodinium_polyedra.AAC.1